MATHSSILVRRMLWTEDATVHGVLKSWTGLSNEQKSPKIMGGKGKIKQFEQCPDSADIHRQEVY